MKFLSGMGIFFTMYSQITSMLYFSWADIGTTGAPSAIVPCSMSKKGSDLERQDTCYNEMVTSIDLDEFLDCFMLIHRCTFLDKVNLVLQNGDMLETHDLNVQLQDARMSGAVGNFHLLQSKAVFHP